MATSATVSEAESSWLRVLGTLNEYQAWLFVAQRALELGRGGVSRLVELTGMSRPTIVKATAELQGRRPLLRAAAGRIRQVGGGRPPVEAVDPKLLRDLRRILEEATGGDPMRALKWTSKSTRTLAADLQRRGHPVAERTVARILPTLDYSWPGNVKSVEGRPHPDRDAQVRYINGRVKAFQRTHDPVISVDTKKKALIGAFRNAGRTWRPRGQP